MRSDLLYISANSNGWEQNPRLLLENDCYLVYLVALLKKTGKIVMCNNIMIYQYKTAMTLKDRTVGKTHIVPFVIYICIYAHHV